MLRDDNYLNECYLLFPKMTHALFGKRQDLLKLEHELRHVVPENCLDREDLLRIINADEWDYKRFWPELEKSADMLTPIRGCFQLGWGGRAEVVNTLYKVFKQIEIVSIVLRFIDSDNYAIISPPVEKLLGLQPEEDHVQYYLSYLDVLKRIADIYGEPNKLAHVDMALWCLFFIIKNKSNREFWQAWEPEERKKKEYIYLAYTQDVFFIKDKLRRALKHVYDCIKVANLNSSRLILAECLNDEASDPLLAMVATSYTFESLVWSMYTESPKLAGTIPDSKIRLGTLIEKLRGIKINKTIPEFIANARLRDRSVHPWLPSLSPDERKTFIAKVDNLIKLRTRKAL